MRDMTFDERRAWALSRLEALAERDREAVVYDAEWSREREIEEREDTARDQGHQEGWLAFGEMFLERLDELIEFEPFGNIRRGMSQARSLATTLYEQELPKEAA